MLVTFEQLRQPEVAAAVPQRLLSMLLSPAPTWDGYVQAEIFTPFVDAIFEPGSTKIKKSEGKRQVGRPRNFWPQLVRSQAISVASSESVLAK